MLVCVGGDGRFLITELVHQAYTYVEIKNLHKSHSPLSYLSNHRLKLILLK